MSTDTAAASGLTRQAGWLKNYRPGLRVSERGRVISLGDGIAWIDGLPNAAMDEVLELEDGSRALVFHLARRRLGAILLYQTARLTAGASVELTGRRLEVPVGDALLGRVIDPLGMPLDGQVPPPSDTRRALDVAAPPILARDFVARPLYTGNKIIDTMIPIGMGQRQLLIGDNGAGKSALAIDAVINQCGKNVKCVYVLIGQKRSTVVNTIEMLRTHGALAHTVVVVAEATALPGLKYLAPFAGCAVAEGWMNEGEDTVVVYDDITMHAQTYRRALAPAAAAARPRGLSRRYLLPAFTPAGTGDLHGGLGRRRQHDRPPHRGNQAGRNRRVHSDQPDFHYRRPGLPEQGAVRCRRAAGDRRYALGVAHRRQRPAPAHQGGGRTHPARLPAVPRARGLHSFRHPAGPGGRSAHSPRADPARSAQAGAPGAAALRVPDGVAGRVQ